MVKTSLLLMLGLTVLIAMGMRWREDRAAATAPLPRRRPDLLDRGRRGLRRWTNAAALAALLSILILGGLQWLRVWQG
ncbi:hypothetical protein M0638_11910 [Roseomonas sp. NAR14]|uniref:Uncharacterized protein n=1 Tax=Roseomonas acroporae TaxID=2937791 RepID=A0A9X1Y6E9_9PROT|nr:hypothetical protein [Roseomonas acroporae]MCK8785089.1 hypothetical protein [Roseomonas acroporae]